MGNNYTLTPSEALEIYERAHSGENQRKIAEDYVISQATVSGIKLGRYWNDVTGHERTRPLTPLQERTVSIYSEYWDKKQSVAAIAEKFGVSLNTVYDIRNGSTGHRLTGHPHPRFRAGRRS